MRMSSTSPRRRRHSRRSNTTTSLLIALGAVTVSIYLSSSCSGGGGSDFCFLPMVEATISIADSGRTFESRPDHRLGPRLWKGYEYMGRMQYILDNPTLCPDTNHASNPKKYQIVKPEDGLPVALVAATGGCSDMEKAVFASSMIEPPNVVQYLILKDPIKRRQQPGLEGDDEDEALEEDVHNNNHDKNSNTDHYIFNNDDEHDNTNINEEEQELLLFQETSFFPNQNRDSATDEGLAVSDDESYDYYSIHEYSPSGSRWLKLSIKDDENNDGSGTLNDRLENNNKKHSPEEEEEKVEQYTVKDDRIQVAVLHVSNRVGLQLFNEIAGESRYVRESGGTKILLNGKEPVGGLRTVLVWMLTTLIFCACACCCMLMFVQTGFEEERRRPAPVQPVRRRLTLEQVRTRFPAFHYDPEEHHANHANGTGSMQYCQLLDECTICLDEFHAGVRCRELPCKHVFHSTCIARWLIERSAVCPLCKLDLYEEEEEDEEEEEESSSAPVETPDPPSSTQSLLSWWTSSFTPQGVSHSNVNNNAAPTTNVRTHVEIPSGAHGASSGTASQPNGHPAEPRSWWPFSVESAPTMEEEEHDERPAVSQWRLNWFGQGRRRRRTPTDGGLLTELTEPLIASDREGSQPSAVEVDQNALEEVTFAASPTATQTGAGPAMTTTTTAATAVAPQIDPPATSAEV